LQSFKRRMKDKALKNVELTFEGKRHQVSMLRTRDEYRNVAHLMRNCIESYYDRAGFTFTIYTNQLGAIHLDTDLTRVMQDERTNVDPRLLQGAIYNYYWKEFDKYLSGQPVEEVRTVVTEKAL